MLIQVLTESNETPFDFDQISRGINFLEMCQILTKEKWYQPFEWTCCCILFERSLTPNKLNRLFVMSWRTLIAHFGEEFCQQKMPHCQNYQQIWTRGWILWFWWIFWNVDTWLKSNWEEVESRSGLQMRGVKMHYQLTTDVDSIAASVFLLILTNTASEVTIWWVEQAFMQRLYIF